MGDDRGQPRADNVSEALAAIHEHLVEGGGPSSPSLAGLDPDELARVLRLQDCLVRLERARVDEPSHPGREAGIDSTAAASHGSTFPRPRDEESAPEATIGFSDVDGVGAADHAPGSAETGVVSAAGAPGRIGRFEILRVLGRGGQGLMLLANDPVLARHVALKLPWSETLITPQLRRRFLREAQAVARLTHPHIVAVYDVGEVGPICFIASAFVDGQSLAAWLKERALPIDSREAATIVADLAHAMHYAHGQGVLHRDLKPANVLLEPPAACVPDGSGGQASWAAKIADFGLAKILDLTGEETRSGAIVGTPSYMSPEQANADRQIGPATDIYALGAILYELLAGRPPFRGGSDIETLRLVACEEPVAPRRMNPRCPPDLEAICLKCLEKAPARRYGTAGALADDLGRFLGGGPTSARPLSVAQRAARWSGRNRGVAAMLATIAVLLVSITAVSTVAAIRIGRARDQAQQTAQRERAAKNEAALALVAEQQSLAKAVAAERTAQQEQAAAKTQADTAAGVSNFLVNLFMTADPLGTGKLGFRRGEEVGKDITLLELLDRGASQAQRALADQPVVRARLLDTLGKVYSDLGLVDRAEPLVRAAYELRLAKPEDEADLATSRLSMGVLLGAKGKYAEAERLLRQALEMRTRLAGPDSLEVAEVEVALGWTLMQSVRLVGLGGRGRKEIDEFDKMMLHALDIQRRALGSNHRDVGLTLTYLAMRYFAENKQPEAEKMLLQAAAVFASQKEGLSAVLGLMEFQAAALARRQGKFNDAERRYKSSIKMLEQALGRSNLLAIATKADLGGLYHEQGRMKAFEENGRDVLTHWDDILRVFPLGHPMFIEPMEIWAAFVGTQGKHDESVMLLEKIVEFEERFQGPSPLRRARRTFDMAGHRLEQGSLDEAERLFAVGKADLNKLDDPASADFGLVLHYHHLRGALTGARGDLRENERILRECVAMVTHDLVSERAQKAALASVVHAQRTQDPETLELLALDSGWATALIPRSPHSAYRHLTLAQVLIDRGKFDEAEPVLKVVNDFVHPKTMPGSYYIGWADSLTGTWLAAMGKRDEAEPLLVAGLENLRKSRGDHHRLTHEALDRLVSFYRQNGRSADAERYIKLLTIRNSRPADGATGE
ncbi:MAG: serine/threonine protein kinase [Planctomycetia bacterium]|nr:serine/threonine protein kinase [Planctomycetia bacterium]